MQRVKVSYHVDPTETEILNSLSPSKIIELSEVYEILSHSRTTEGETFALRFGDAELTAKFVEIDNGYRYEFVGSDFYKDRDSEVLVTSGEDTTITVESYYTLNSIWSFVLDRLVARSVRREHDTLIGNILGEVTSS